MTWIKKRNILNLGIGVVKAAGIEHIDQLYCSPIRWRNDKPLDAWATVEVGNGVLGEKRAKKIIEAIEKSRTVSLPEFLGSMGIKGVGRSLCRILCEGLPLNTIDDVYTIKPEQIESLEGFGHTRAHDFCNWILEHENDVENLASCMIFEDQPDTKGGGGVFDGETICFTGKSPKTRPEMTALAESAGASVSSSVSSSTTILVIADTDSMSPKAVKARKMKIKIITTEDFLSEVVV
jgi:DNA ligase (NAD+)